MPSGNVSSDSPRTFSAPPELLAALHLLVATTCDADTAWEICQAADLAPDTVEFAAAFPAGNTDIPASAGVSTEGLRIQIMGLAPAHPRLIAESLSGVLLGASFGSGVALRLVVLRDALHLGAVDCLRLITAVWPQVMHEGSWSGWYAPLKALMAISDLTPPQRLSILDWLSTCARWLGDFENAGAWIEQALQLANQEQSQEEYARFTLAAGTLQRLRGRLLSAESTVRYARARYSDLDDLAGIQRCSTELAQIALERGEPDQALEQLADVSETAQTRALRGEAHLALGDYCRAVTLLQMIPDASLPNQGRAYALLGKAHLLAGRLEEARTAAAHAVGIWQTTDDNLGHARGLALQGEILFEAEELAAAIEALEQAYQRQRKMQDSVGLRQTLLLLLRAYPALIEQELAQGQLSAAQALTACLVERTAVLEALPPVPVD